MELVLFILRKFQKFSSLLLANHRGKCYFPSIAELKVSKLTPLCKLPFIAPDPTGLMAIKQTFHYYHQETSS